MSDYLPALQNIFCDVLGVSDLKLTPEVSLGDIPHCDSVALIQIVLMIENTFGFHFETDEVANLKLIGDFLDLMEKYG